MSDLITRLRVSADNFDPWDEPVPYPALAREAATKLEKLEAENKTMRKHLGALHVYAKGEEPGRDLNEFAKQFPRTWNAIVTDNPTSFDLPDSAGDRHSADD